MIKSFLFLIGILYIGTGFAQTKMIAHKSHSGSSTEFKTKHYADNFGKIAEPRRVLEEQSSTMVVLLPNDCVKVFKENTLEIILCDHPYFSGQYTMEEIRS